MTSTTTCGGPMTGGSTPPSDTRVRRNSPNRDSSSKKPSNTPLPIHVDDPMRVGQVLADALGKPRAHVTRHQGDPVRVAVMVHEVPRELLDGARALAGDHADHVAPRQVGDHGDVPVAFAAGLVDADGLHTRVVLVEPGLVHVMADESLQPRVVLADLRRDVRHRLRLGELDDHGLEQERGRHCPVSPTAPEPS